MTRMTCSNEAAGRILVRGLNARGWGYVLVLVYEGYVYHVQLL